MVKYGIGQPMGLYSSWPALAITNHILIRLAAYRIGEHKFDRYLVLGDDVVIFCPNVSKKYVSLMKSIGVSTKPEDSIKPKRLHTLEMAKRLFRGGVEISPIPLSLMKTNLGLFAIYLRDRGVTLPLVTLYPGETDKLLPLTAAALLWLWKRSPSWREVNNDIRPKNLGEAISRLAPSNEWYHFWGNGHLSDVQSLAHNVFENWTATESYKLWNSYESGSSGKSISIRKLKQKTIKLLSYRERRTKLSDPIFRQNLNRFIESGILNKSLENTTQFKYVQNQHSYVSNSEVIGVTELYDSYIDLLNEMRQWIIVEIKDVWLDSRDKLDEQMILGIEKAFKELKLTNENLSALYEFALTQDKLI